MARLAKPPSLTKRREFLRVQQEGRRFKGRHLVLIVLPAVSPAARVGYTVSRKVGNAVVRNRVRRRLREIVRTHPQTLSECTDHVIIAFSSAAQVDFHTLQSELTWLLSKANKWVSRSALSSRSSGSTSTASPT